jgi:2-polyprenyl-3-methyl-5-hydroxy-6-metoxy-1,4-benzoquinol methylase
VSSKEPDEAAQSCREHWDQRHARGDAPPGPSLVLRDHEHLLPTAGRALDLACGLGGNALWLARRGLQVSAWDSSPVAIERLSASAQAAGLAIDAQVRDVVLHPPPCDGFDLIVVTHFLERLLAPAIAAALKPGGVLCYQTFVRDAVSDCGPSNTAYRLGPNELLRLFPDLRVYVYREEGRLGDCARGVRDIALLVARRVERP